MKTLLLIPKTVFDRVREAIADPTERDPLVADMCRANTLVAVKRAGSGHLGSSFSAMDIVVHLYLNEMNVLELGPDHEDRDIYFSSKGHDVPGLYALLFAVGMLPKEKLLALRRLGGVEGHPSVETPGVEASTGSLGMGISKGRGILAGKRMAGRGGQVYVMLGDGELQEGQIYEGLQTTAHHASPLTVIVDHNKLQSDKRVAEIVALGDLPAKLGAFGWHVARCDGHDPRQLKGAFDELRGVTNRPKILIADTIKGRGVSFMEHPRALEDGKGSYRWHAGAPDDASFQTAHDELLARIRERMTRLGLGELSLEDVTPEAGSPSGVSSEFVADHFGEALVEIAARRKDIVVLDGDLALDCRIRRFEETYPERFIENGIAEQDMVSMAGGLALQGHLPVVNSFANFLAARANEQIYNNAGETGRIIYVAHFGGLIPAGPGKSHQAVRDISLFGALPGVTTIEPANGAETRMALEYCVDEAEGSCVLRLIIGPSPRVIELPSGYRLEPGRGIALTEGADATLFSYGPVMLHEALKAAEALAGEGFGLRVVNMPWLNRVDGEWLGALLEGHRSVWALDDHSPYGGLGDSLLNALNDLGLLGELRFRKIGILGLPACGTPPEVLQHHGVDGETLARRIPGRLMYALFWDVDGTLLTTRRAGVFALEEACRVVAGRELDLAALETRGLPDSEIAARIIRQAGLPADEGRVRQFLRVYEKHLPSVLGRRDGMALPGVIPVLEHLRERRDVLSLLLTGNTRAGARVKLKHFGLDGYFERGAFADDARDRTLIARRALEVAEDRSRVIHTPERRFVIGDTPHDVACGRAIEARTVVVATGGYDLEELQAAGPWLAWTALPEPGEFVRALGLPPTPAPRTAGRAPVE